MVDKSLQTRYLTLGDILRLIEVGALGLPDFQRRFTWGADQVRSFLGTVFMGWPAGSILLMEAPPKSFFAVRNLEGVEGDVSSFGHLLLDGQQRVTALAQAFGLTARSGEPIWYVDVTQFENALESGDIEDAFVRRMGSTILNSESPLVPVSALRSATNFEKWRDEWFNSQLIEINEQSNRLYDRINRLWVSNFSRASRFDLPCTVLPADMPLGSVSIIFEKLNTAGTRLDTFDLVVAHVYRDGRNLRSSWDREVAKRQVLRKFAPSDPLIAVELIAMVKEGDTRRSGLLNLDPNVLWDAWPKAVSAIESAAQFLVQQAGINNSSELPHRGILLTLAGVAYELNGLDSRYDDLLLYWTYSRGLAERFNAAVNTRVVSEFRDLVQAARGKSFKTLTITHSSLQNATRRANSSILKTVQAIIRRNRPFDYPDGILSVRLSSDRSIPVSLLKSGSGPTSELVFGFIVGTPRVEAALANRSLESIHSELRAVDAEKSASFTRSQMLPSVDSPAWNNVSNFVRVRVTLVLDLVSDLHLSAFESSAKRQDGPGGSDGLTLVRRWLNRSDDAQLLDATYFGLVESARPEALRELAELTRSQQPLTREERLSARLLYARALDLSGQPHSAITQLEIAERDAVNVDADTETERLKLMIAAQLGGILIRSGRVDEGVVTLTDALSSTSPNSASPFVRASMLLECANGLAQLGDRRTAVSIAWDLINGGFLGVGDRRPELEAMARQLISRCED